MLSPLAQMNLPESLVCGYLVLIPILWAMGLNLPVAFLVIFGTLLLFVRSRFAWRQAVPWFMVGAMQFFSVLMNWADSKQPVWMIAKHLLASYVSGWFLLGAALAIGASGIIRFAVLLRAITSLTFFTVLLAIPTILIAFVLPQQYLYVLTPLGYLVPPSLPSRAFSFGMFFYNWDYISALHVPRIALFYPWPTALGFAGICTVFVLRGNPNGWRRTAGITCGVAMVVASLSRTAMIAAAICSSVRWAFTWPKRIQVAVFFASAAIILGFWLVSISPTRLFISTERQIEQSRPDASQARNAVYEASWAGIRRAPLLGHGWPGDPIQEDGSVYGSQEMVMVVGSHSTISGVLYKGGTFTFVSLMIAFMFTCFSFLRSLRARISQDAVAVLIAILLTSPSEGLESLVFPTLFVFLWLGSALLQVELAEVTA